MEPVVVSRSQSVNAIRKLRAAAFASIYCSTIFLRSKKTKSLVASHDLSPEEVENLQINFKRICADGENATLPEFEEVLKAMKKTSLVPIAAQIFSLCDDNQDGTVNMKELLCGLSSIKNSKGDEALQLCFKMYDTDRSGSITKEEVASMLTALPKEWLPEGIIREKQKLDEIFDMMDVNNDGTVSFEEFKAAMQKDSSLQDVILTSIRTQTQ